ncbi:2-deoxy-5-keto-D-gluconate 6-phosphate aldolase domain-containing protein [Paralcaligenes ginsengisoli]
MKGSIMNRGYNKPLYLLPFDHRQSYVTGMFKFEPPLGQQEHDAVADSKQLIYEGFRQALTQGVPSNYAALLVDEEFGSAVLRDALKHGYATALSVEKSGVDEFEFEYGNDYASHIETFKPVFAKILVRYNPEGDEALNRRQTARIRQLSEYCQSAQQLFMFELLVPATPAQIDRTGKDKNAYDVQLRPELMRQSIEALQDAGIEPDVWKIEGLDRRQDCERIVQSVRRNGRDDVCCIVLGRGADESKVAAWLKTAATVPGFTGFAVGRTSFWDAVADYRAGKSNRHDARARIASRYSEWVHIFEQARSGQPS